MLGGGGVLGVALIPISLAITLGPNNLKWPTKFKWHIICDKNKMNQSLLKLFAVAYHIPLNVWLQLSRGDSNDATCAVMRVIRIPSHAKTSPCECILTSNH